MFKYANNALAIILRIVTPKFQLPGNILAVNIFRRIPATPEIKPAPINAGISGMKIAEIWPKALRHHVCFNCALC